MANAINSPTAQNLSHKSIIELANITYENARAAVEAKGQADADAEAAENAKNAAAASANAAEAAKNAAAVSADAAADSADAAAASSTAAEVSKTAAERAESGARTSETIAGGYATNARTHATAAAGSADAAATYAADAADSASNAADSAAEAAAAMGNKVDKTTTGNRVYATADNGDPLPLAYSAYVGKTPGTNYGNIVYRAANGFFFVKNATADDHPAAYGQAKRFYASIRVVTNESGEFFEYDFPRVLVDTPNTANLNTVKKISQHVLAPFVGHETAGGTTTHGIFVGDPDYTESICIINNAYGQFVPIVTNNASVVTVNIFVY